MDLVIGKARDVERYGVRKDAAYGERERYVAGSVGRGRKDQIHLIQPEKPRRGAGVFDVVGIARGIARLNRNGDVRLRGALGKISSVAETGGEDGQARAFVDAAVLGSFHKEGLAGEGDRVEDCAGAAAGRVFRE